METPWVAAARGRLAAGEDVRTAFLGLRGSGAPPADAATAVCVAAGSGHREAVERYRQFAGLWDVLEPGEEADGVDLLIAGGYFEADAVLGERQRAAVAHLRPALAAVPAIPSGLAASLAVKLRTGRLAEALRLLEDTGARRWPGNPRFRSALRLAAAEIEADPDRRPPTGTRRRSHRNDV